MKKYHILRELHGGGAHLLDMLFPPHCVGCGRNGTALCPSCITQFRPAATIGCPRCGCSLETGMVCRNCHYSPAGLSELFVVCNYEEPLRSCIHALKYAGQTPCYATPGRPFGEGTLPQYSRSFSVYSCLRNRRTLWT